MYKFPHPNTDSAALTVFLLLLLLLPSTTLAAGDANSSRCSLTTETSSGFRSYLPDCRAYEMVSPLFKDGGLVATNSAGVFISSDGSRVADGSVSPFAGTQNDMALDTFYEFQRQGSGWETSPLAPPAPLYPLAYAAGAGLVSDADLGASLWAVTTSATAGAEERLALETSPGGSLLPVGPEQPPPATGGGFHTNVRFAGGSSDLSHIVLRVEPPKPDEVEKGENRPWPGDTTVAGTAPSLFEYNGTAKAEPVLVGVSNNEVLNGAPYINQEAQLISQCGTTLGAGTEGYEDTYNAVSSDGSMVFFTAHSGPCTGFRGIHGAGPTVDELFARDKGAITIDVSEPPLSVPDRVCSGICREDENEEGGHKRSPGYFVGASQDGSRVYFVTDQPLLDSDSNTGMDLYQTTIRGGEVSNITQVSADPNLGQASEVQGVVRVSEDGSHVYFVAKGVLTAGVNHEGKEPNEGGYNLYVYHSASNTLRFISTLLTSGEEASLESKEKIEEAEVEELAFARALEVCTKDGELAELFTNLGCYFNIVAGLYGTLGPGGTLSVDRSVWGSRDVRPAQATPDGQFLVFLSSADLTGSGNTSRVPQLFEYDAQKETVARISIGHDGYGENGNVTVAAEAPHIGEQRYLEEFKPTSARSALAISDDGTRIFFETKAKLVPQALTGATNVYEYHNANTYLISDGQDVEELTGESAVKLLGTDGSGRDVFISTADPLVLQDTDTQADIYDVREGGGFASPMAPLECAGVACQGGQSPPPSLLSAGSNVTESEIESSGSTTRPAHKPKRYTKQTKRNKKQGHKGKRKKQRRKGQRRVFSKAMGEGRK